MFILNQVRASAAIAASELRAKKPPCPPFAGRYEFTARTDDPVGNKTWCRNKGIQANWISIFPDDRYGRRDRI